MKLNQLKVKLIKIDGINILHSKGVLNMDTEIVEEKKGLLFRDKNNYKIETDHIKREKKGKAIVFIDVKESKSFNPHTSDVPNLKCQNCLQYLMQRKQWEARQTNKKYSTKETIFIFLAGIGGFFLITQVIGMIFK